jgi:hypothetical protein
MTCSSPFRDERVESGESDGDSTPSVCAHGPHASCSQVVGTIALRAILSSRRLKIDGSPERFAMMDAIDVYLDTILFPQLEHLGVQSFPVQYLI